MLHLSHSAVPAGPLGSLAAELHLPSGPWGGELTAWTTGNMEQSEIHY